MTSSFEVNRSNKDSSKKQAAKVIPDKAEKKPAEKPVKQLSIASTPPAKGLTRNIASGKEIADDTIYFPQDDRIFFEGAKSPLSTLYPHDKPFSGKVAFLAWLKLMDGLRGRDIIPGDFMPPEHKVRIFPEFNLGAHMIMAKKFFTVEQFFQAVKAWFLETRDPKWEGYEIPTVPLRVQAANDIALGKLVRGVGFVKESVLYRILRAGRFLRAKELGNEKVQGYYFLDAWANVNQAAMTAGIVARAVSSPKLKSIFLEYTRSQIIEANCTCAQWGIGWGMGDLGDEDMHDERMWGMNFLGKCHTQAPLTCWTT